jgi:hypothetical protein
LPDSLRPNKRDHLLRITPSTSDFSGRGHAAVELSATKGIQLSVCDIGVGLGGEVDPSGVGSRIVVLRGSSKAS